MSYNAGPADFTVNHQEYENEDVIEIYDNWTNYEQAMLGEGYLGHIETVNLVSDHFPVTERRHVNIIDIGAGSGLVGLEKKLTCSSHRHHFWSGLMLKKLSSLILKACSFAKQLRKQGFSYIDALEPCTSLSQQARDRNVYNNYITESLSLENHCNIPNDTYHCATAVACFSGTHIPSVLLVEVLRILKPGGLAFITVRDLPENLDLIDVSKELETKGILEIIQTYKFPRFRKGIPGLCYIFKKPELV